MFAFLEYRTGDRGLAEDLVADTFERIIRNRHRFSRLRGNEKQWIYAIALNLARDRARRAAVERRAIELVAVQARHTSSYGQLDTIEARDELREALEALTEQERETVALRFGADLTLRELARVLGESEHAIEGRLYRGLVKLRDQLE